MQADQAEIGIIGGSGLYDLEALADAREIRVTTPYGDPSDALMAGSLGGRRVVFLPRHGRNHRLSPTDVPYRANIYALKSLGVRQAISISAVGSLREDFVPGDIVVPDQIVDRTRGVRPATFFGQGLVAHVPLAEPYCPRLRPFLAAAVRDSSGATVHQTGTYCCMEGPQFSTRAESNLYRSWGMDVIGMTALPEAKLAREAELCYAGLALVTDYDCWRLDDGYEDVSATTVADVMRLNNTTAKAAVETLIGSLEADPDCACHSSLAHAFITPLDQVPQAVIRRYRSLVDKYVETGRATVDVSAP